MHVWVCACVSFYKPKNSSENNPVHQKTKTESTMHTTTSIPAAR